MFRINKKQIVFFCFCLLVLGAVFYGFSVFSESADEKEPPHSERTFRQNGALRKGEARRTEKKYSGQKRKKKSGSRRFSSPQELPVACTNPPPENPAVRIVYEDDDMLVLNKPEEVLTFKNMDTGEEGLLNFLVKKYECRIHSERKFRIDTVNRLDRNTSGLVIFSKNNRARKLLRDQFAARTVGKKYRAIVDGVMEQDSGTINKPVGRVPKTKTGISKMAVLPVEQGGKPSLTEFRVLERFADATYLEVTIHTGRTHQIRVHLSSLGHPLFGDGLYGSYHRERLTKYHVLQSYYLKIKKPSGGILELELEPDARMTRILEALRASKESNSAQ